MGGWCNGSISVLQTEGSQFESGAAHQFCGSGVIGKRCRLKPGWDLIPCRFESCLPYVWFGVAQLVERTPRDKESAWYLLGLLENFLRTEVMLV